MYVGNGHGLALVGVGGGGDHRQPRFCAETVWSSSRGGPPRGNLIGLAAQHDPCFSRKVGHCSVLPFVSQCRERPGGVFLSETLDAMHVLPGINLVFIS